MCLDGVLSLSRVPVHSSRMSSDDEDVGEDFSDLPSDQGMGPDNEYYGFLNIPR